MIFQTKTEYQAEINRVTPMVEMAALDLEDRDEDFNQFDLILFEEIFYDRLEYLEQLVQELEQSLD